MAKVKTEKQINNILKKETKYIKYATDEIAKRLKIIKDAEKQTKSIQEAILKVKLDMYQGNGGGMSSQLDSLHLDLVGAQHNISYSYEQIGMYKENINESKLTIELCKLALENYDGYAEVMAISTPIGDDFKDML